MRDTPATNLDFLRWKHGTHEALSKKLDGIVNWNELSKFALGDKLIPKSRSRAIELRLELPDGWLDRDNLEFSALSKDDHALVAKLLSAPTGVKGAIHELLVAIANETLTLRSSGTRQKRRAP